MTTHLDLTDVTPGSAADTRLRQAAEQVSHLWWVPLVAGVVSIGMGMGLLVAEWTVTALVTLTGILLVLRGLALALHPAYAADGAREQVLAGVVGIGFGFVLIFWPQPTLLVLAALFGIWLAASGAVHIVSSLARRTHLTQWKLEVAIGTIELLLGLWVMRRRETTLSLAITVIGLWTVITGVIYCVQAFEIRAQAKELVALTTEPEPVTSSGAPARRG